jgi:hypothetical protein
MINSFSKKNLMGSCLSALAVCALFAGFGCSSTTKDGGTGGTTSPGGGGDDAGADTSAIDTTKGSCASPSIALSFSPMYSAFIPGSTAHKFQIPVVTADGSAVSSWSSSDPTQVSLTPDPVSGGVMVTVEGTGPVTIFATAADGSCGASVLNITTATEDDWQIGNARYNDGNSLRFGGPRGDAGAAPADAAMVSEAGPACTNCHGPTASTLFKDVAHTPEQTGGFSDQDLIQIITAGQVPDGGYFDPNVIVPDASGNPDAEARAQQIFQRIHTWNDIGPDQQKGIVVYLRSLTPAPQEGSSNFGGRPDGGFGDGGRRHRDGGFPTDGAGPPPPVTDGATD